MKLYSITATKRWLDEIMRLERECFADPWTEQAFLAEFENRHSHFRLAFEEKSLRGYIVCWLIPEELHILNLAVDPRTRRRGVASFLLQEAFERFCSRGGGLAVLEVRTSNLAARELYRRHGFSVVGRRPNYYQRLREDALIMSREITPEAIHVVN